MSGKRVVSVGIAVLDKIFGVPDIPSQPIKIFAKSYGEIGGGPAATGSVAIARLGGRAELWARVGDDAVGMRIIEELAEWGVKPRVRRVPNAKSSVSGVLIDDRGERLIISFSDDALDPDASWLPLGEISRADAVLADTRWPDGAEAVLKAARNAGVPSVLDADLAPEEVAQRLAPLADYVIFSAPALARFAGRPDAADPADALAVAQGRCSGTVGVTVGAEGFRWLEAGELRHAPAPSVTVIDTLGAGDVFHGAFALAIAEGASVAEAARFANMAAALKCTRPGGRAGIPDRAEVDQALGY
ncbi:PfkB family carbohydrate kinase [Chelatococcus sp. GCM10030263]|uniref:PfkB family carbohydrate kinase n=1 Tax=Chelatococcus sp. GCM10030263 TaxID=3273387 RepID=UPI00360B43A3